MNYISHFYFDRQDGNDYYNLGIVLPDLVRSVSRNSRMPVHRIDESSLTPAQLQLHKGSIRHYEADKKFHNSNFFREFSLLLKNIFLNAGFDQNRHRLSVTSHIFLEMMLDRVIISDDRSVADAFYSSLNRVDAEEVAAYLQLFNIEELAKFKEFFNIFRERQYIYHYVNNESMLFSLNRVLQRVKIEIFEPEGNILRCIDEAHVGLHGRYHLLAEEVGMP